MMRPLKLGAFHQRIGVDVAAVDELGFVGVDREHELLAGVEAAQIEHDLRAAVDDRHAVDREAVGADDRQAAVVERAEAAGGRVEEHVAFGEAVLLLVAVDRDAVERRAGGAADERDLNDVRLAVVAGGFFEVHRAQQHLRRDVGRHQPPRFKLFDLAATRGASQRIAIPDGPMARFRDADLGRPETQIAKCAKNSHELPPCTHALSNRCSQRCANALQLAGLRARRSPELRLSARFQIRSVVS